MEEKKLVPKLRFPGFTEPWEQRKFKNFVQIRRGLTYKPSDIASSGIRVLRSSNINEDQFITGTNNVFVNIDAVDIPYVKNGDILLTSANGSAHLVGKHAIINDIVENSAVHGGFMLLVESKNPQFINALLGSNWYKKFINLYVSGGNGAIGNLSKSDLEEQDVMFPSEEEQKAIGRVYFYMNHLITLHQRKLEHLKLKKKSLLQKLFPKEGEVYPELRFPGFTDPWEQRKLDEVFQIIDGDRGKNYPGTGDFLSNGDVLFLDTGNVRKDGFNFDNKRYIDFNRDKLLRNGRLILGDYVLTSRGTLGNLAYYSQSIYNRYPHIRINSAMLILRMMNTIKVNNLYLYITLRSNVINEFMKHNFVGSAQPHITKKEFSSVLLPIPRQLEEQKIIGDFFDKLEKIITLHQ